MDRYADNKILRKHFVHMLCESLPRDTPEHAEVLLCMQKNFLLNGSKSRIIDMVECGQVDMTRMVQGYVDDLAKGTGRLYEGRADQESGQSDLEGNSDSESERESN
jgi:hypothetical protein